MSKAHKWMKYLQPAIVIGGLAWLVRKFKKKEVEIEPD